MIKQLRSRLDQEKGKLSQLQCDLEQTQTALGVLEKDRTRIEKASIIIQEVSRQTQENLSWKISGLVSLAMDAIFPDDDYEFSFTFTPRRGRTEADIFLRDSKGNPIKPFDADGGGLINVVAFALRVSLWSLKRNTRPVLLLDEPFMFLHSRDAHTRVSELLKTISEKLKLQIIMISGEETQEIIKGADNVIKIKKIKGISEVA
jgi:DNA repair exonuclease SbcCD ATPase subunit